MKKITFFLFLFVSIFTNAQNYTLSGKVVNKDNQPLLDASILIKDMTQGTSTNQEGIFKLSLLSGTYTLQISYLGFKTVERKVILNQNQNIQIVLDRDTNQLDEVIVQSVRVNAEAPITHSNLSKKELERRNLGQDIATQLNFLPSVVTTSDAGAGVGYTGFRVRGTANQGINVTINGIPYNDAESATSFFVNLQDFTSSIENIQLQRGVGTSTNGSAAFGASLNILTDAVSKEAYASISNSFGSFNTRRHNVKFSTGLINNHIEISGRISQIKSDGYIDRASSDLKSYFLQAAYQDENTLIKLINFAGSEVTYQSWFGVDAVTLSNDRTFNPAGQRFDDAGNPEGFHENQVDDYKQDHFQLHWTQQYDNNWTSNFSLNYTYGRGFFEEYQDDWYAQNIFGESDFSFYGLSDVTIGGETITSSDIIRRRWLDNDFYVASTNVNYKDAILDFTGGLFYSFYEGDHFGEVIWARFASDSELGQRYYEGVGKKNEFSLFAKANYKINNQFQFYLDLQGRFIGYKTDGQNNTTLPFLVDENFSFFNPKFGATYKIDAQNQLYGSFARAFREPNRTDFENGSPRAERLDDIELGWRHQSKNMTLSLNGFYMNYKNQLVLTGALDNVGAPIRANSGSSYRLGVEMDANIKISQSVTVLPNAALSTNQNRNFFFETNNGLENLGNTEISFSPSLVAGNTIIYQPTENLYFSFLSKYVGEQYLNNRESTASRLESFVVNDLNIIYSWKGINGIKGIDFSLLINNIFDEQYESNGADFGGGFVVFYPQAGINFLAGVVLHIK